MWEVEARMLVPTEGFWRDAEGRVFQHSKVERRGGAFEFWIGGVVREWVKSDTPGFFSCTPCEDPSKMERRSHAAARRWMVAKPWEELHDYPWLDVDLPMHSRRWNPDLARFEHKRADQDEWQITHARLAGRGLPARGYW